MDLGKATAFAPEATLGAFAARTAECNAALHNGTGRGSDFLGWLNLPKSLTDAQLSEIEESARVLRENCEIVVVIGIGGSYLGAKAVIDALSGSFDWLEKDRKNPVVLYAGQNIGEDYIFELQQLLRGHRFGIICISKSGTTTEPALAFRLLKTQLEEQQGVDAARRLIVCVTDRSRGALRTLATQEGYRTFVIEDNVGGRYSVLTPVGLLPIAVAGFDIRALIAGAARMQELCADAQCALCRRKENRDTCQLPSSAALLLGVVETALR